MKKYVKFVIVAVIVIGAVAYLTVSGFSKSGIYYLEVSELLNNPKLYNAKGSRISGKVVRGSAVKNSVDSKLLEFQIEDTKGEKLSVEYSGVVPDAFEEGVIVIVEGKYDPDTSKFYANKLMAKCPSKYEPESPEKTDKV